MPALVLLALALAACGRSPPPARAEAAAAPVVRPGPPTPAGALRLAALFPRYGRYAQSGAESFRGVRLGVETVNRRGGVRGRPLFLAEYPTGSDVPSTRAAAVQAVRDGALALVGSNASLLSEAVARVAEAAGVVMVSNVSTATALTRGRPFVFRVCYANAYLARLLVRFLQERFGVERVAVLQEASRLYSRDLGEAFVAAWRATGRGAFRRWSYHARAVDFTGVLEAMRDRFRAQALFLPSSYDDASVVALHLRALRYRVLFLGGDSWAHRRLFALGLPPGAAYHTDHWRADPEGPFARRYRARYGRLPEGGRAALAHDAVLALAAALEGLGPLTAADLGPALGRTRRRLREALARVDLRGATGRLRFDREGNALRPTYVFRVDPEGSRCVAVLGEGKR